MQLLIFDAAIKSKPLYGMETVQLTDARVNKLDAFRMEGLRKSMGKKHTYWDGTATNDSILHEAAWIISGKDKAKGEGYNEKKKGSSKTGIFEGKEKVREQIRKEQREKETQETAATAGGEEI